MRLILLFTLILGLSIPAYSQNYQTVNSSEVKLFESQNNAIRGYRIDSLKVLGSDTLLFPSRTIQNVGEEWDECFDVQGASMFGDYVQIMPNGTNLFFNKDADTIRINTMAQQGETWKVWKGEDFDVYGEMGETVLSNVFGIADSVKSIKLNAYDSEMNLVQDFQFNDYLISISKNYGFLTAFNFYAFPDFYEDYFTFSAMQYSLYGIESQDIGGSNLTTFDIFDFQPGDIIHYEQSQISEGYGFKREVQDVYLSREEYATDSIVYGMNVTVITYNYDGTGDEPDISFESNQTSKTVIPLSYLEKLPGLPCANNANIEPEYYSVLMTDSEFIEKQSLQNANPGGTLFINDNQDCYAHGVDGLCGTGQPDIYLEGLGGPYYNCNISPAYIRSKTLKYFLKDSVEWGVPLDFSLSLTNAQSQFDYTIFPNPASDKLTIKLYQAMVPSTVEIVDLSGRAVFSKTIDATASEIDISKLQSGLYFVWFPLSGNKSVRKLVIR
ncbi:T9SS type A sorting domain-containing protein [Cryomorpha ignava]|uniref:T9SS type A sorting domain-containing protein n=1 Tax=Cryomorpha ignava TaxID=101383 RepID=A0A7K3WST2_9FLAO|nr:T9SS type A sorting domain-containing protein [Cryomorpha ignava]NEN24747.1 T9SS type A sorting domain-containing protein [Cryomorpha ignava]